MFFAGRRLMFAVPLWKPGQTLLYTALAVSHAIQMRARLSVGMVVKQLRPLRRATITIVASRRSSR